MRHSFVNIDNAPKTVLPPTRWRNILCVFTECFVKIEQQIVLRQLRTIQLLGFISSTISSNQKRISYEIASNLANCFRKSVLDRVPQSYLFSSPTPTPLTLRKTHPNHPKATKFEPARKHPPTKFNPITSTKFPSLNARDPPGNQPASSSYRTRTGPCNIITSLVSMRAAAETRSTRRNWLRAEQTEPPLSSYSFLARARALTFDFSSSSGGYVIYTRVSFGPASAAQRSQKRVAIEGEQRGKRECIVWWRDEWAFMISRVRCFRAREVMRWLEVTARRHRTMMAISDGNPFAGV